MNKIVKKEAMQAATSFLLGQAHGGMMFILVSGCTDHEKVQKLIELELKIRHDIDKLYYSEPVTRDPASAE